MSSRYPHLLAPGRIGPMTLRNRILLTSMGVGFAEADGICGERIRAFNAEIARGGAALVTMGVVGVGWPVGRNMPNQPAISDDRYIPGIRAVADAVHAEGANFAVQLHFGGLVAAEDMLHGNAAWTPSLPQQKKGGDMLEGFLEDELAAAPFARMAAAGVKVMEPDDIQWLVRAFAARFQIVGEQFVPELPMLVAVQHGGDPATHRFATAFGGDLQIALAGVLRSPCDDGGLGKDARPGEQFRTDPLSLCGWLDSNHAHPPKCNG